MNHNTHDDMVDKIRRSPHHIGIEDQVASTGEVIFWEGENYVTSPDSLIFTPNRRIFVIEYKSNDKNRRKDFDQLERHVAYTQRLFKESDVKGLYVHGRNIKNLGIKRI